jgi:prepilin-type N-terminal cleavage/methylation domain-containing protein
MKTRKLQFGMTLIEILVAAAIVAVLAGIVLTTLTRIDSRGKENLCLVTLETLNTALRQFRDYGYEYRISGTDDVAAFYKSLTFPPDCNNFDEINQLEPEITGLLGLSNMVDITPNGKHDPNESGIACMYFFLSRVPQCRETLAAIDPALIKSDHNNDKDYMRIITDSVNNRSYPWIRIVDPWGKPLRYDYYDETEVLRMNYVRAKKTIRNFPLITSAGPDGKFGTADDITNRDNTKGTDYTL